MRDDLSALFAENPKGPALPASYRMGVLLAFDPDDGTNTVAIGTSTLDNVPFKVNGAEIGFSAGDNVLLMFLGNTVVIDCKIATPGSANYGASNNGRAGILVNLTGFANSTSGVTVLTDSSIVVPKWANSCLLNMNGGASMHNNSGAIDNWASQVRMSCPGLGDVFSAALFVAVPSTTVGSSYAVFSELCDVTAGESLTFTYLIASGTRAWPSDSGAQATMSVQCQFFREAT